MLKLNAIVGLTADREISTQLHLLDHEGRVEFILLDTDEIARRHQIVTTDRGTSCRIGLPRTQRLVDGAVLLLECKRAIVVKAVPERWLIFDLVDAAAGLELGYCVGNMHWPVRFMGRRLYIIGELGADYVLDRLQHFLQRGAVNFLGESK